MMQPTTLQNTARFMGWFLPILFWLASAIAGWLLHFKIIATATLVAGCLLISTFMALYLMGSDDACD